MDWRDNAGNHIIISFKDFPNPLQTGPPASSTSVLLCGCRVKKINTNKNTTETGLSYTELSVLPRFLFYFFCILEK